MKKTVLLLLTIVLTACGQGELNQGYARAELRGLKAVGIGASVGDAGKKAGLSEDLLKTQIANSLRNADIEVSDSIHSAVVGVDVGVLETNVGHFVYGMRAYLCQAASLDRNPAIFGFAQVEIASSIGVASDSEQLAKGILEDLEKSINEFVIAYLLANKKE